MTAAYVRYLVAGTVIVVLGVALGYRPGAGVGGVVAALARARPPR